MKQLFVYILLLGFVSADCPNGSVPIPELPGEQCWVFVKDVAIEVDQWFTCMYQDATFLSVHNTFENNLIVEYAQQYLGNVSSIYLGMEYLHVGRDIGWGWYDGTPMDYFKWALGEPKPSAECGHLDLKSTNWISDGYCPKGSVPIPELTGECWVFVKKSDVEVYQDLACVLLGTEMISIHNTIQNNIIAQYAQQQFGNNVTGVYLGLEWLHVGKDLGWCWEDGTPTDYLKWAAGEPKLSNECVHLNPSNGNWFSDGCVDKYPTICRVPQPGESRRTRNLRANR
ncbi:unnamed protein product, partial [Mesorhabditis belari]|uniref:C-type lectin domain-containing protein n=1 Tax=Mesorhabditis belari TaxID=2138241 RepID=A0AAF3EZ66_9BILA